MLIDAEEAGERLSILVERGFGQEIILRNPSGHGLSLADNGSADLASRTQDVVRAMRSGGPASVTADPYNGFLRDDVDPRLIGQSHALDMILTGRPVGDRREDGGYDEETVLGMAIARARLYWKRASESGMGPGPRPAATGAQNGPESSER